MKNSSPLLPVASLEQPSGFDEEAWRAVLGSYNTGYYLSRFRRMAEGGATPRWHWPGFFFTGFWLIFRKMWAASTVYLVVSLAVTFATAVLLPGVLSTGSIAASVLMLCLAAAYFVLPALFAGSWYYAHCLSLMDRARRATSTRESYLQVLRTRGDSSFIPLVAVSILIMFGTGTLLFSVRSELNKFGPMSDAEDAAAVFIAASWGRAMVNEAVQHKQATGSFPQSWNDLPGHSKMPKDVSSVQLKPNDGTVLISIDGVGSLDIKPRPGSRFEVSCSSRDIAEWLFPDFCRMNAAARNRIESSGTLKQTM